MVNRLLPTGQCWCGCGQDVARGSFFLPGHDKKAESAIILIEYGGVPEFLVKHGYGPGGKNPQSALEEWRQRSDDAPSKIQMRSSANDYSKTSAR